MLLKLDDSETHSCFGVNNKSTVRKIVELNVTEMSNPQFHSALLLSKLKVKIFYQTFHRIDHASPAPIATSISLSKSDLHDMSLPKDDALAQEPREAGPKN
jgi:hypothetical protein